jgi:hypothetical protein
MRLAIPSLVALVLIAATPAIAPAMAQDHKHNIIGQHGQGHAEGHDWYKGLNQPGTGYSCCNAQTEKDPNGDCRPTRAYQTEDGTWRAMIDGKWQTVPPRAVLQTLAPDGNSHICASKGGMIFCFIGGSPKS